MELIRDTIDLSDYMEPESNYAVKVKPASDWMEEVELSFRAGNAPQHSGPLFKKMSGEIEFRPGEVSIWAGINGHRKSTFTSQIALDLCKQKERVLIISLEMSPARTMQRMTRQACGGDDPTMDFIARFHKWTDNRLWLFDHVGTLTPAICLAVCRYFHRELKGTHVFIDSMMKVVTSEEHLDEQKKFINDVCTLAHDTKLHPHVIHHVRKGNSERERPGKFDLKGSGAISDQADNIFIAWRDKEQEKLRKTGGQTKPDFYLSCEKQRNGASEECYGFWFDSESMQFLEKETDLPMRITL